MAADYAKCAKEILDTVGGRANLVSAAHCATRLRLVTVDNSRIDMKKLENIDGVKGVFSNNGQLQLIIGTGTVNKVYDEFIAISGMSAATGEEVKAAAAAKQPVFKRMVKALGDVFVPILPAIVASGLMMGLVEALGRAMPAFAGSDWYGILDLFSNTAFTFLPILIAVSAARVFGGNIFLGAVIGMIMIHPNLINAWSVASMDAADIPVWHLLGLPIRQVGYQGHVIPVIIAVWIMCKLENWLHRHVPEMIDLFVTPLCAVLITGFLTIGLIGPVFSAAETYVLAFASWIITVGHGIGAMIMGAIYPLTVVCGIHHMYNVIEAGLLASDGLNIWMPIASAANFAQGAACLAVGLKARKCQDKICCGSLCIIGSTWNYRAGNLWGESSFHETVCMRYDRRCGRSFDRDHFPYRSNFLRSYRNPRIPYDTGLFRTVCTHAGNLLCSCICTDLALLEGIPGGFQGNNTEN